MFRSFPKVRPPLPGEFARIYAAHYRANREGGTPASALTRRVESWLHKRVAGDVTRDPSARSTLEIGAGTLNQLPYEPAVGPYDIVEPFRNLYEASSLLPRIRHIYSDIADVPASARYDRITSIATFEHICDLPDVIARAGLLLAPRGVLRASIPSEGTLMWTLGWKLTTGLEFRIKHGLDYGVLMRHEHVNTADEIEDVLRYFFSDIRCEVFGVSRGLSLYRFYRCADPRTERCRDHLLGIDAGAQAAAAAST